MSNPPPIFLCQVCDQTPERGHAPDCPGSLAAALNHVYPVTAQAFRDAAMVFDPGSGNDDLRDLLLAGAEQREALDREYMDKREILLTMRTHIDRLARKVIDAEKQLANVTQERDEGRQQLAELQRIETLREPANQLRTLMLDAAAEQFQELTQVKAQLATAQKELAEVNSHLRYLREEPPHAD